ncbi:MAG: ABC transporter substrate-binding protein, partial [Mycobacterium sp.]
MRITTTPTPGRRRPFFVAALVALVSAIALLLSSCAGSGGPEQTQSTGTGEVPKNTAGNVRILMENVPDSDIVKSMVADFNK